MSEQADRKRMIITVSGVAVGTEDFSSELTRFLRVTECFINISFLDFQPDRPPITITTIDDLEYQDYAALLHRLVNLPVDKVDRIFELVERESSK